MNELSSTYSCHVDFFFVNVDHGESSKILDTIDVRGRSTYVLLGSEGEEQSRWFGPLPEAAVAAQISPLLEME